MQKSYEHLRIFPPQAPPLIFDAEDQKAAWELHGSNCGPGAIAGLCGETPQAIVARLGQKFQKLGGTTEVMVRNVLTELNIPWTDAPPGWVDYGLLRIQWDGPWIKDPDPFEKHRHSHWVGVATCGLPHIMIFDINAISVGGWVSLPEWDDFLRPWLLETCEPSAFGPWSISDAIRIDPLKCGQNKETPCRSFVPSTP